VHRDGVAGAPPPAAYCHQVGWQGGGMAITERRLTLEEFLRLPEEEPPLEYLDGRVTQKVSPQGKHGRLEGKFSELINRYAEPRKLAIAIPELRTTYSGGSAVPDIAVYRWDRVPVDPDGTIGNIFCEPPDIAIEISSPGQSVRELIEKCRWFVDHGVPIALLAHPERRWVRRFRAGAPPELLSGADRIDLDEILPGFELTVDELFATLYHR
jgi:Uma2 family endonuclease